MTARRWLLVFVAIGLAALLVSGALALQMRQVANITNELVKADEALSAWIEAVNTSADQAALTELAVNLQKLVSLNIEREFQLGFLSDTEITENTMAGALTLQRDLVDELYYCHLLHTRLSTQTSIAQVLLVLVLCIIGWLSFYMGRRAADYRLAPFPEANPNPVIGMNGRGDAIYLNQAARELVESSPTSTPLKALLPSDYQARIERMKSQRRETEDWWHDVGGRIFHFRVQALSQLDRVHLYAEDVTEHERVRRYRDYLAYHDVVSGMANRNRLEQIIHEELPPEQQVTLLMLYVPGTSVILSTQGIQAHDEMTKGYSRAFKAFCRSVPDLQAERKPEILRFDLNMYGCLFFEALTDEQHRYLQEKLELFAQQPINSQGSEFYVRLDVGVYTDAASVGYRRLMQACVTALYYVSTLPKVYQRYDVEIDDTVRREADIEVSLHRALKLNELSVVYQPKQDIRNGRLIGFEALMRWQTGGEWISPAVFIPLAEKNGLIHALGEWLLDEVLRQMETWHLGSGGPRVSINVSPLELARPTYVDEVMTRIQQSVIAPEQLQFELTESFMIEDAELAIERMQQIRAHNVRLAIDDFGTGYSSFSYLSRFPVDKLKIDRSFIISMDRSDRDRAIVQSMVDLAHGLGMSVIAEGVETEEQRQLLKHMGCDQIQGYLYGKPMLPEQAFQFLNEQREVS